MVFDHQTEHGSQWATIMSIAGKIGCTAETLRSWVRQAERDVGQRAGLTTDERERIKVLEREVRGHRRLRHRAVSACPPMARGLCLMNRS